MRILGIETSADDTGIALIEASGVMGQDFSYTTRGNALLSQVELHTKYGGIFPNLAKREHGRNLVPVLMECLHQAGVLQPGTSADEEMLAEIEKLLLRESELYTYLATFLRSNTKPPIDCIAVTAGPGLEPALWVGVNFAKALSLAWNVPIVAVNHLEGHILISALRSENESSKSQETSSKQNPYPALALLVSGGHTEIIHIPEAMKYELVGRTRDDAAGEAFDKSARLMGLPYPGGPEIAKLAREARVRELPRGTILPRPMLQDPSYDFSFSGLKTAVRKVVESWQEPTQDLKAALAREVEDAIADVLLEKTKRAAEEYGAKTVIVGGGVSANQHLRTVFAQEFALLGIDLQFPSPEFSTDNGVMIALAGYFHAQKNEFINPADLRANGNLRIA
jgi:N6-L-threonylcarbamoyladenine synthase